MVACWATSSERETLWESAWRRNYRSPRVRCGFSQWRFNDPHFVIYLVIGIEDVSENEQLAMSLIISGNSWTWEYGA